MKKLVGIVYLCIGASLALISHDSPSGSVDESVQTDHSNWLDVFDLSSLQRRDSKSGPVVTLQIAAE